METVTLNKSDLKRIIKESVKEAITEERHSLFEILFPSVSKKEMLDIEKRYKRVSEKGKTDYKDMTEWVMK